jgi:hypothetical protein
MGRFREITIPGDVLDNDDLPDDAKILYGKIARLSYKNGYCWASNGTLSGKKSERTTTRNIKLLEKFGYVKCAYEDNGYTRKIYICEIDSRVKNPPDKNVTPPDKNVTPPPDKNVYRTIQDEHPKRTEERFSAAENLNPNLGDFSLRLEKLRGRYNALKIGPPFKKTAVNLNPSESSDLMKIMRTYQDDVSLGAMENYAKITNSPEYDPGGCVYRGFVSFMIRGVEKYCGEAEPFELFRRRTSGPSPPEERFDDWSNFGEKG